MTSLKRFVAVFFVIFFTCGICISQEPKDDPYKGQVDIRDVLRDWFGMKKAQTDTASLAKGGKWQLSFLPGISYSTATGFLIGFNLNATNTLGDPKTTSPTSVTLSSNYTSKNQFNVKLKSDVHTKNDDWYIETDIRYSLTSQPTYGLGMATPQSNKQIVEFDLARIYGKASYRIFGKLYLGAVFSFDDFFNINTVDTDDKSLYPNEHNEYNKLYLFDTTHYKSSGPGVLAEFDSRDNVVNPYKGIYAGVRYIYNGAAFGSTSSWQNVQIESKNFLSFGKTNKHVFALWLYGSYVLSGNVPYMSLPATGWDKYEKSGRGYDLGRFRGKGVTFGEFEYRFPISSNGLIGATAFVNLSTASNQVTGQGMFKIFRPGYGGGLRIKFNKYSRTNIAIDFGKGIDNSSSFSLNLGEAF